VPISGAGYIRTLLPGFLSLRNPAVAQRHPACRAPASSPPDIERDRLWPACFSIYQALVDLLSTHYYSPSIIFSHLSSNPDNSHYAQRRTMKIAILDDYQDSVRHLDAFNLLAGHDVKVFTNTARGAGQLAIRLAEFDALVLIRERTNFPKALLEKLPNLKLISQTGKVSGHIDVKAATAQGIAIVEGVGDPTAPAELTWALIMAASRRVPQYVANLKVGAWQSVSTNAALNTIGVALKGRRLGIWGYGKIGRLVAGYGKAFGMQVTVWGREPSRKQAEADGYSVAASKEAFFSECDIVTLHLRLNDATHGIVGAADLARMKTTALFVNTSRAELVENGALEPALEVGRPGYAALDVYEAEPLAASSALLRMDNVVAAPHLGYVEKDGYELYFRAAFQNIVDFANGAPKNVLNPEALRPAG
jgi:D-3-phosphoglycerate dehydrogenase